MSAANIQTTISPYTQKPLLTRPLLTEQELNNVIAESVKAQKLWKKVALDERLKIADKWMEEFEKLTDLMSEDLSLQMGRPISSCKGEISGTLYRARHLIKIASDCLKPIPQDKPGSGNYELSIVKEPLGVVGVVTPWNFPFLTMINSVLPAILSGNTIILKPAPQTPVTAERLLSSFLSAGLPQNVIQVIHLSQETTLSKFVTDPRIDFVCFTGSVPGGRAVQEAASKGEGFKGVGLELGGKDPAYVREDVDVAFAAEQLVDGSMFNSGQSCCAVERIYVHSAVYDDFVKRFVDVAKEYKLGDPSSTETTLGPVVSLASASRIRKQVKDAVAAGAELVLSESEFPEAKEDTTLVGPQVLVNVTHEMDIMMEETFGPVVGIMKVESDEEALGLMNDSPYGLTASVWTSPSDPASLAVFNHFVEELESGMVYLNRADAPEPSLPWTGVKNSGRGITLSTLGYDQLTRAKGVCRRLP